MRTKQQITDDINDKLGTEIDWSEMKKDDLEYLEELIDSGALMETLGKHYLKRTSSEKVEEAIDDWEPGQIAMKLL